MPRQDPSTGQASEDPPPGAEDLPPIAEACPRRAQARALVTKRRDHELERDESHSDAQENRYRWLEDVEELNEDREDRRCIHDLPFLPVTCYLAWTLCSDSFAPSLGLRKIYYEEKTFPNLLRSRKIRARKMQDDFS